MYSVPVSPATNANFVPSGENVGLELLTKSRAGGRSRLRFSRVAMSRRKTRPGEWGEKASETARTLLSGDQLNRFGHNVPEQCPPRQGNVQSFCSTLVPKGLTSQISC